MLLLRLLAVYVDLHFESASALEPRLLWKPFV
jgi:hypothetical protein